jgi:hypothetical protein
MPAAAWEAYYPISMETKWCVQREGSDMLVALSLSLKLHGLNNACDTSVRECNTAACGMRCDVLQVGPSKLSQVTTLEEKRTCRWWYEQSLMQHTGVDAVNHTCMNRVYMLLPLLLLTLWWRDVFDLIAHAQVTRTTNIAAAAAATAAAAAAHPLVE